MKDKTLNSAITSRHVGKVCEVLLNMGRDAKSATKYIDAKTVIRATWRHKPVARASKEIIVKIGRPNFKERARIKQFKQAKVEFPVRNIQLTPYPKKRK